MCFDFLPFLVDFTDATLGRIVQSRSDDSSELFIIFMIVVYYFLMFFFFPGSTGSMWCMLFILPDMVWWTRKYYLGCKAKLFPCRSKHNKLLAIRNDRRCPFLSFRQKIVIKNWRLELQNAIPNPFGNREQRFLVHVSKRKPFLEYSQTACRERQWIILHNGVVILKNRIRQALQWRASMSFTFRKKSVLQFDNVRMHTFFF